MDSSMLRLAKQDKNKLPQADGNILLGNHMRGHKTQHIPQAFWSAAGLLASEAQLRKGRVFPIFITGSGDKTRITDFRVLAESNSTMGKTPIALRQLMVSEN
jgi:hypothetical protein